jgi:hypothetical protein
MHQQMHQAHQHQQRQRQAVDPLAACYGFLRALDRELQGRIDGLEAAVQEHSALCHRVSGAQARAAAAAAANANATENAARAIASPGGAAMLPPPPAATATAAAAGDDALDGILERARRVRLSNSGAGAGAGTAGNSSNSANRVNNINRGSGKEKTGRLSAHRDSAVAHRDSGREGRAGAAARSKPPSQADELDRILAQARGLRGGGAQSTANAATVTAVTDSISGVHGSVASSSVASLAPVPAPPPVVARSLSEATAGMLAGTGAEAGAGAGAALLKADGRRIEKLFASLMGADRGVYHTQSRVLSAAAAGNAGGNGDVVFPRSIPYYSLKSALSPTAAPAPPTERLLDCGRVEGEGSLLGDRAACYAALTAQLRDNRKRYAKHMKRLLREGEKVSNIGTADREELFKYYYEHQSLLELYEILRVERSLPLSAEAGAGTGAGATPRGQDAGQGCMSAEMGRALDAIRALPRATPIDLRCSAAQLLEPGPGAEQGPEGRWQGQGQGQGHKQPQWLASAVKEVDAFNGALKTRTQFAVETVLARTALMESVRRLKQCTLHSRTAETQQQQGQGQGQSEELTHEWVEALKLFRSVWACLCGGGTDRGGSETVSFVHKTYS